MPILENNVVQNRGHYDLMPQEKCWYKWWLKVLQIRKINHKETWNGRSLSPNSDWQAFLVSDAYGQAELPNSGFQPLENL